VNNALRDKTLALAGVFQAAKLAQQLARRGHVDDAPLEASIRSVLITDSINTVSIYGGVEGVRVGLDTLCEKMGGGQAKSDEFEIARYVLQLVQLARKLASDDAIAGDIAQRIDRIKNEYSGDNGASRTQLYASLAQLYKDTLSSLRPKIIVQGEHGYLADPEVVDKVRTVLLAGVRSAFLWGQLGGSRWQLLFDRRNQLAAAKEILAELNP
jgi:high frequency lysogenization protein